MSRGGTARDYLDQHVTDDQAAEVRVFVESLPEPDGTIQEVFARAQEEAVDHYAADPVGRALVQKIHDRKDGKA